MISPKELIFLSAQKGLKILDENEQMPPGHNGPYFDEETPVRNNAHWAMLFLKAFSLSKNKDYLIAARKCISFLKNSINENYIFECRMKEGKDKVNGLIGQAWAIEPLGFIQEYESDSEALHIAKKLIKQHKYDKNISLWFKSNLKGQEDGLDYTFNHQLWFTAIASKFSKFDDEIDLNCLDFLNNLYKNIQIDKSGRILQSIKINFLESQIKPFLKRFLRRERHFYNLMKEIGYHGFNTYAFALLFQSYPNHDFWISDLFKKILDYFSSTEFSKNIKKTKYGFPYNPPGIEVLATSKVFGETFEFDLDFVTDLWNHQIAVSLNKDSGLLSEGSFDKNTNMARAYEAILCI